MEYLRPLIEQYQAAANESKAEQMSGYLKGLFQFYGISHPQREVIDKNFFRTYGWPPKENLFDTISELWQLPQREFQH